MKTEGPTGQAPHVLACCLAAPWDSKPALSKDPLLGQEAMPHPSPGPLWPPDLSSSYPPSLGDQRKHQAVHGDSRLVSLLWVSPERQTPTSHCPPRISPWRPNGHLKLTWPSWCLVLIPSATSRLPQLHYRLTGSLLLMPNIPNFSLSSHSTPSPSGCPVNAML